MPSKRSPTIAVVIPAFGRPQCVQRAIESALVQESPPDEVIVVDDCSAPPLAQQLPTEVRNKIVLLRLATNGGGAVARNAGISAATSDFIALLDSDDAWVPTRLRNLRSLISKLDAPERHFFYGPMIAKRGEKTRLVGGEFRSGSIADHLITGRGVIQSSTLAFSRTHWPTLKFDDKLRKHQDWDLLCLAQRLGLHFTFLESADVIFYDNRDPLRLSRQRSHASSLRFFKNNRDLMSRTSRKKFIIENFVLYGHYTAAKKLRVILAAKARGIINQREFARLAVLLGYELAGFTQENVPLAIQR
ncbi:glycosyltransferase family 2 protein [Microvirga roseola]|uniref:glycosyltransferase family 2 protein n=1 Tax=Microvirga roseola TaxID=2883126 RepID=UPI001E34E598|nr:glycosyltransferase family 2 protein [Microvirga roseola]